MIQQTLLLVALVCAVSFLTACAQEQKTDSAQVTANASPELAVAKLSTEEVQAKDYLFLNEDKPGTAVDVQQYLVPGKTTIVGYMSSKIQPCVQYQEWLLKLVQTRKDLAVRIVDINRPGVENLDFDSPAAEQIKVDGGVRVPFFFIYDPSGKLKSKDVDAVLQVRHWIEKPAKNRREME